MTAYRVLRYKAGKTVVVFNAVDWYILYSHASKYYTYINNYIIECCVNVIKRNSNNNNITELQHKYMYVHVM